MNENKNSRDELLINDEDKSSEMIGKVEHEKESKDEMFNDYLDESEGMSKPIQNESKQQKTTRLVEQARSIVKEADAKGAECRLLLADDLAEFEDAKINLKEHGLDRCKALLETMGYRSSFEASIEEKEAVVIEPKEEVAAMVIKEVFSGKFTGLFSALVAGTVVAVALVYLATEKLGITLNLSKVPSPEVTEEIESWFSTLIGMDPNIYIGIGVFALIVMVVMAIVYRLWVSLKANSNLHHAVKQFVEAELYAEKKMDCKDEFTKVDAHMKESVKTLKTYEVLFNEQQGKLQRILHIEGAKSEAKDYYVKSFATINETKNLIESVKRFMAISMSKEGKLSAESVEHLKILKKDIDDLIEGLYGR